MQTRRNFLKSAILLSGAAALPDFLPASVERAFAIEPEKGTTYLDAEHIVILMQENRSFDHTLGSLQGVRGFNDPRALRLANGSSVFVQADRAGNAYAPWRLNIRDTRITWMGSIPHSRNSQVDAWNEGRHDGWIEAKRTHIAEYADVPMTMGHYTREDLPFYYALADAFTVCDQHYCSAMTSTTPNRSYFWTGTVRDRQDRASRVFMRNEQLDKGGLTWKTFPERLHAAGVSWKFYQNELTNAGGMTDQAQAWLSNFGCNPLEYFNAYCVAANPMFPAILHEAIARRRAQITALQVEAASAKDDAARAKLRAQKEHLEASIQQLNAKLGAVGETIYKTLSDSQKQLHDAAFVTNSGDPHYHTVEPLSFHDGERELTAAVPKGDVFYQFRKDVNEGKLPAISWLTAPEKFSDHPTAPWYGAWYVSEVIDILTKNPEVWKKTIFILTYDENDGYFDHAPSFVAADPKRPETGRASQGLDGDLEYTYVEDELAQGVHPSEARSGPIGMGFRVPMIVASPWSRGGWVNSQLFDHTSTVMFLENFVAAKFGKQVKEENLSAWRRAISGDLSSVFRANPSGEKHLKFVQRDKFVESIEKAREKQIPNNYRKLSAEEIQAITDNPLHAAAISHQEKGIRPACALPYELYAHGKFQAESSRFVLSLTAADFVHGKHSAGAPFNVYLRNLAGGRPADGNMRAATYTVRAGDTLREEFPLSLFAGNYHVEVFAPNGFYRSFTGSAPTGHPYVELKYQQHAGSLSGNVEVHLRNDGSQPLHVEVADLSYKTGTQKAELPAGSTKVIVVDLHRQHGWYDLAIRAKELGEVRFAGRVETGRSSFTDPLMGGVV